MTTHPKARIFCILMWYIHEVMCRSADRKYRGLVSCTKIRNKIGYKLVWVIRLGFSGSVLTSPVQSCYNKRMLQG